MHAAPARERIEVVDPLRRHAGRAPELVLPVLVHQLAELLDLTAFEERPDVVADRLRPVEVGAHLCVPALGARDLVGEDRGRRRAPRPCRRAGGCCAAGRGSRATARAARRRPSRPVERVRADPAVRRDVLVLLAGRLAEDVDLDLACVLRETSRRDRDAARQGERLEEADGERPGRAEARPGRNVGDHAHLQRVAVPVPHQRLAQDRMLGSRRGRRPPRTASTSSGTAAGRRCG